MSKDNNESNHESLKDKLESVVENLQDAAVRAGEEIKDGAESLIDKMKNHDKHDDKDTDESKGHAKKSKVNHEVDDHEDEKHDEGRDSDHLGTGTGHVGDGQGTLDTDEANTTNQSAVKVKKHKTTPDEVSLGGNAGTTALYDVADTPTGALMDDVNGSPVPNAGEPAHGENQGLGIGVVQHPVVTPSAQPQYAPEPVDTRDTAFISAADLPRPGDHEASQVGAPGTNLDHNTTDSSVGANANTAHDGADTHGATSAQQSGAVVDAKHPHKDVPDTKTKEGKKHKDDDKNDDDDGTFHAHHMM